MHVFSSLFFFGQAWLIILGFSMIIHVPCMFFLLIFSFAMHGKLSLDYAYLSSCCYQRWSRGHKARGQGQGHKKNPRPRPRPRTAFPRTDTLEAKDRNARGQGQGPRTQPQVFSTKKGLQNFFSGTLQFIGVARIFDWKGLNHKSHAMTSSKICLLAFNQDFANGESLN